ncbi:unnamed protein product [Phyllotreta striolata]|uniref:Telomere-associated protein RIF1 n=1 Tax=Phyllotreta striolata TaxID=444603 RepID=A0A9N9TSB7_PHYSR|nr:unnamed protein product [Phyllotreta striolata]
MCTFIEMDDKVASEYLNGTDDEDEKESAISKQIYKVLIDAINKDKQGLVEVLLKWKICHSKRLLPIMDKICSVMTKGVLKTVLLDVINKIMSPEENLVPVRDTLIDVGLLLSASLSAADLTEKEYASFLDKMKSRYIPAMTDFQNSNYSNWHKIWMCLVKFCGKKLHQSTDLTNNLLRIVENAFRNSSNEQRLKGYDCWKEFIDNAGLDKDYLCKNKQITLLVTPLRAKFSKQESIIYKRFEVFVYLLETLQDRAVLCLKPFLEVVFGTLDNSKLGLAKSVKQITPKSIQVLIGILGHGHGDDFECVDVGVRFDRPVINETNFKNFYESLVNSVIQSCSLLNHETTKIQKDRVMQCLWKSLFNHIISSPTTDKKIYFSLIKDHLDTLLKHKENPFNQELLKIIFKTAMSFNSYDMDGVLLKQFLVIFITLDVGSLQDEFCEYILQCALNDFSEENETLVYQTVVNCLISTKMEAAIVPNYEKIWLHLMDSLTINQNLITSEIANFYECFMWPLSNLHIFQETEKKQIIVCWIKQLHKLTSNNESKKINIINDTKHRLENNPSITPNGLSLLNAMSQCETKFSSDFVTNLLTAVSSILLSKAKLSNDDEIKICHLVTQYLDPSLNCYKDRNELVVKSVSSCIKSLLSTSYGIKIIEELHQFLKNSSNALNHSFSIHLKPFLVTMHKESSKNNDPKSPQINKLLMAFNENESKRTFIVPTKRSARMVKTASDNTFKLFGKDSDDLTEVQKLSKTSKKAKTSKLSISKPLLEENSEDFVAIDTEVKLQPDKLSEHQKEVLKTRRPDIPALYEDLSQSVSQDLFNFAGKEKSASKNETCRVESKEQDVPHSIDLFSQESNDTNKIECTSTNGDTNKLFSDKRNNSVVGETNPPLSNNLNESPLDDSSKLPEHIQSSDDSNDPLVGKSPKTSREIRRLNISIVGVDEYFGHESRTRTKKLSKKAEETKSMEERKAAQKSQPPRKPGRPRKSKKLLNFLGKRKALESPVSNGSDAPISTETPPEIEQEKPVRPIINAEDTKTPIQTKKPRRRAKSCPADGVLRSIGQANGKPYNSLDNRKLNGRKSRDDASTIITNNTKSPDSSEKKKRAHRRKLENFKIDNQNVEENIKMTIRRVTSPKSSLAGTAEKTHKRKKLEDLMANISNIKDTEDVIESSQDSIVKTLDASKSRVTEEREITSQDTTLTVDSTEGESSPKPPRRPSLTESELFASRMDTMSVCETDDDATQSTCTQQSAGSIVSSSLSCTPRKLTVFLPSSPINSETPTRNNELMSSTIDISPISSKNLSLEDFGEKPEIVGLNEVASSDDKINELPAIERKPELIGNRTKDDHTLEDESKLINEQFERFMSESLAVKKLPLMNVKFGTISSPSLKTLKSAGASKQPEAYTESDILTFSREIPSPYAVPKSSILKRKMCDGADNDGYSPCPKRKRVNFSDPCLTSKKIIVDDDQQQRQAKRLFEEAPSEAAPPPPPPKGKPIYARLALCEDDARAIVKRLAGPLFLQASMDKLKEMNVKTVGDLARLSEAEVGALPLKVPVVANLLGALENHYKKTVQCKNDGKVDGAKALEGKVDDARVLESKVDDAKVLVEKVDDAKVLDSKVDDAKVLVEKVDNARVLVEKVDDAKVLVEKVDNARVLVEKVDDVRVLVEKVDDTRVLEGKVDDGRVLEEKVDDTRVLEGKVDDGRVLEGKVDDARVLEEKVDDGREPILEDSKAEEAREDPASYLDASKAFLERFLKDGIESSKADRIKTVAKYVQDCNSILIGFICSIEDSNR